MDFIKAILTSITKPKVNHPEFQQEADYLAKVIEVLTNKTTRPSEYSWESSGGAADEHTAKVLYNNEIYKLGELQNIVPNPYFGRIDFIPEGYQKESFYFGYKGFEYSGFRVIDWRAPISQLFYKKRPERQVKTSYLAPNGVIWGLLKLKRHLKIENRTLLAIDDEYDDRTGFERNSTSESSDEILIRELYTRGDTRLQDIVKTIQEHQDKIIRYPADSCLVINGVAGSGKTSIVYHRVAYLLYPETNSGIQASKTIVFNPNRLFLSYVKNLLPSLGVKEVLQVTFNDWALGRMGLIEFKDGRPSYRVSLLDKSVEVFINHNSTREERINHWKRSKLKGSLKFARLLDNYIEYRRKTIKLPADEWIIDDLGIEGLVIPVSIQQITNAFSTAIGEEISFDKQRLLFINKLEKTILDEYDYVVMKEYDRRMALALSEQQTISVEKDQIIPSDKDNEIQNVKSFRNRALGNKFVKNSVINNAITKLKPFAENIWLPIHREDYFNLLQDSELFQQLGNGIFNNNEISLLTKYKTPTGSIDIEDIPAILYLFLISSGKSEKLYDHIVVDEAQDFSPLQFKMLTMFSVNGSMTIAGDISQGIYAHRGISDWSELKPVFEVNNYHYEEIDQNYRSTKENVEFTNIVLKNTKKKNAVLAKPFNRAGIKPQLIRVSDKVNMPTQVFSSIKEVEKIGVKNVGIITKTPEQAESLHAGLLKIGKLPLQVVSNPIKATDYETGIVILPVTLAKGLEFECALVVDVDEENYNGDIEYDGRLLYVAVTRALHLLRLFYVGKASSFLNGLSDTIDII
jgi:DNA helicase II / ATP-dependent DNA helicase PcrA